MSRIILTITKMIRILRRLKVCTDFLSVAPRVAVAAILALAIMLGNPGLNMVLTAPLRGEWPWDSIDCFGVPHELSILSTCDSRVQADSYYDKDSYVTGLSWREQKALRIASTACRSGRLPDDIVNLANRAVMHMKSTNHYHEPTMQDAERALAGNT